MASRLNFILLFHITNNILYVHYPPRTLHGVVCFENKTTIGWPETCNYMKIVIINNSTSAMSYKMQKEESESSFFKILFYYPNNTIFDTNWIENYRRSKCYKFTKNNTIVSIEQSNNSLCIFSYILNIGVLCVFLILFGVIIYNKYRI